MSPETSCAFVSRATWSTWTSPETEFTSSRPATCSSLTSPLAVFTRASPRVSCTVMSPEAVFTSTTPYCPRASTSADFVRMSRSAPSGQVTRRRMSGPRSKEIQKPWRACTSTTTSCPSPRLSSSIRADSTSSRTESLVERASSSTCVSSVAAVSISMRPEGISKLSRSGPGVEYVSLRITRADGSNERRSGSSGASAARSGCAGGSPHGGGAARPHGAGSARAPVRMGEEGRAWSLLSALAVAGHAAAARVVTPLGICAARDLLQQPGVRRDTRLLSGGIDDRLERLRQSQRDSCAEVLEAGRRRRTGLGDVDELRLAAADPHLHVSVGKLGGELRSGLAECIHQPEPEG